MHLRDNSMLVIVCSKTEVASWDFVTSCSFILLSFDHSQQSLATPYRSKQVRYLDGT